MLLLLYTCETMVLSSNLLHLSLKIKSILPLPVYTETASPN